MLKRAELENFTLTELAVLCGQINRSASGGPSLSDKAHVLRLEWVQLQQSPHPVFKTERDIEASQEALKKRMVEFLAGDL